MGSYQLSYTYDAVGNRTSRLDHTSNETTTYTYDACNRLQLEESPAGVTTYTYDLSGNRTRKETPAAVTDYSWDAMNRMVSAEPVTGLVTFTYNYAGQLMTKESPNETSQYLYDGQQLLTEYDENGDPRASYTSSENEYGDLVSEHNELSGDTTFHAYDAQWSTSSLVDENEDITGTYQQLAFGLPEAHTGAETKYTFVGKHQYFHNQELSLYFLGLGGNSESSPGVYDPATGQFLRKDPLGPDADTQANVYRYVGNNPVNKIDPSGLEAGCPESSVTDELVESKLRPEPVKFEHHFYTETSYGDYVTEEWSNWDSAFKKMKSLMLMEERAKCEARNAKIAYFLVGQQVRNGTFKYTDERWTKCKNASEWRRFTRMNQDSETLKKELQKEVTENGLQLKICPTERMQTPVTDLGVGADLSAAINYHSCKKPIATLRNVTVEEFIAPTEAEFEEAVDAELQAINGRDWLEMILDVIGGILDALGLIPGIGIIPDIASGALDSVRGNYASASISLVCTVEGVGQSAGLVKISQRVAKYTDPVFLVLKRILAAPEIVKKLRTSLRLRLRGTESVSKLIDDFFALAKKADDEAAGASKAADKVSEAASGGKAADAAGGGKGSGKPSPKGKKGGPNPGHTPGKGHTPKSGPQKTKRFQKKAGKKRDQAQKEYEEALARWEKMSPDARKLRKELDPDNFKP